MKLKKGGWKLALGAALVAAALFISCQMEVASAESLLSATVDTLTQRCETYEEMMTADVDKSLFRLSDYMQELARDMQRDPGLATRSHIGEYVKDLQLSGVVMLGENRNVTLSYTPGELGYFQWEPFLESRAVEEILKYPAKVYSAQVEVQGGLYDVCAVARLDSPGVLFGYYESPAGLRAERAGDIAAILSGVHMERSGTFFILKDGEMLASSAGTKSGSQSLVRSVQTVAADGRMHLFRSGGHVYYGRRAVTAEGYTLCVSLPFLSVFRTSAVVVLVCVCACIGLGLVFVSSRNRALAEKQAELQSSNQTLQKTVNMLHSLENIYFTVFYVNVETGQYETVFMAPWLSPVIPERGSYNDLKGRLIQGSVVEKYREELNRRLEIDYIRQTLSEENLSVVRHSFYVDYQAIRAGQVNWCRVTVMVVDMDAAGCPRHVMAVLQDVTEEKTREQDYQEQILEEAQAARQANLAKTDFLRRISHDIRTPINGIQGILRIAERFPHDEDRQADCRKKVLASSNFLLDLVNNVLDMSKLETGDIVLEDKPFDMQSLLGEVNTLMQAQAIERGVRYEIAPDADASVRHLLGSPLHLRQILLNIAGNAMKYNRKGGYVRTGGRILAEDETTVVYEFTCEDNGIGMSREFQKHMFEPFMQEAADARTTYQGTGLGLSIVKRLVDEMGGTIACTSEKGVGTTFRVTLAFRVDRAADQAAPVPAPASAPDGQALRGMQVLVTEDNDLNMEIAEFLLTEQGAVVTKAWNGQEAVDLFSASPVGHFQLVLMDIMMPVMTGLEATRAIRALDRPDAKTVAIVAMSANAFQDDIRESKRAGMNWHLSKPLSEEKLIAAVEKFAAPRGEADAPHT